MSDDHLRKRLAEAVFAEHEPALYAQESHTKLWHAVMAQMREIADAFLPTVEQYAVERAAEAERHVDQRLEELVSVREQCEAAEARHADLVAAVEALAGDCEHAADTNPVTPQMAHTSNVLTYCARSLRAVLAEHGRAEA